MPRPKRILNGDNYISKVEKQVNLPKVYTKLPKTERMVNLPRIYYNKIKYVSSFLYKATGSSLSPNINNLRFYDSGLVREGRPIYYDETNTYKLSFPNAFPFYWVLELISGSPGGYVQLFQPSAPVAGTYVGAFGWSGTVTISSI